VARPAVFLDRDGTLNVKSPEGAYVQTLDGFVWLPGAADALAALAGAGWSLFVVSNQRGVARGLVTEETLNAIEREIQATLTARGARIEAFRYCVHHREADCDCRKPRPGMLTALAEAHDIDLSESWMIGDAPSDVAAGRAAGCQTVLLAVAGDADIVTPSLRQASLEILINCPHGSS
jgi:D-glycero-D-manno-heptose 1,7-bisphosphate phosphatase